MGDRRAEDQARGHGQGQGTPGRGHTAADEPHDRYNQDNQYIQHNYYSQHSQSSTQNAGPSQAPLYVLPTPGLPAGQPDPGQQQLLPSLQAFDQTLSQQERFARHPPVPLFSDSAQPPNQPGQLEPLVDPKRRFPTEDPSRLWLVPTGMVYGKEIYPPLVIETQRPDPGTEFEIYLNCLTRYPLPNESFVVHDPETQCFDSPQIIKHDTQKDSGLDGVYVSFPDARFEGRIIDPKLGGCYLVVTIKYRYTNTEVTQPLITRVRFKKKRRDWLFAEEDRGFKFLRDPRINVNLGTRPMGGGEVFWPENREDAD